MATVRSVYSAAKAGVNTLTANLRMDLRRTHPGIHVSLIIPAIVDTDFHRNAIGGLGTPPPPGASPMKPQTADEVASVIANVIERPVAEVYTNPITASLAARYYQDVGAFEVGGS
jgi:short-subunit dehydrogenase